MRISSAGGWATILVLALAPALVTVPPPAAAQSPARGELRPSVPGCPLCELWNRYQDWFLQAHQEVGSLKNGVVYFYHSDNPSVIEVLIRFAYEREALQTKLDADPELRQKLGRACGHDSMVDGTVRVEVSVAAHGVFAILTAPNRGTVRALQAEASRALRDRLTLRF